MIHRSKVRVDKDTPRGGVVSIENSVVSARTLGVIEEVEADSDHVVGVVVDVTIVAVLEREVSENVEDEIHEYKAANKIGLLNPNEMNGEQGIQFIIAKEKLVVVTTNMAI